MRRAWSRGSYQKFTMAEVELIDGILSERLVHRDGVF